jgi:hypothetical protein
MDFGAAKILCVEPYLAVLESRCAILKYSGYCRCIGVAPTRAC